MHEVDDVLSVPSGELQKILRCSREVLQYIYTFAKKEKCSGLVADFNPTYSDQHVLTHFQITITARIANAGNSSQHQPLFESNRAYHLIVVDNVTSELLCYRKFYSKLETATFQVRSPKQAGAKFGEKVCVSLLCDQLVGQDFTMNFPPTSSSLNQTIQIQGKKPLSINKIRRPQQTLLSFPAPSPDQKQRNQEKHSEECFDATGSSTHC